MVLCFNDNLLLLDTDACYWLFLSRYLSIWIANEQEQLFKAKYIRTLIAHKYRKGNVKSTLKKELNKHVFARRESVWNRSVDNISLKFDEECFVIALFLVVNPGFS